MVQDNASSLNAAKELLNKGGSLSEAALMLEAAIQKGDLGEGGYEAWILLGECRSMDECEDAALRALNEGVKKAEAAGSTGSGMLVSPTHLDRSKFVNPFRSVSGYFLHQRTIQPRIVHNALTMGAGPLPVPPSFRRSVERHLAKRSVGHARACSRCVHQSRPYAASTGRSGSRSANWIRNSVLHGRRF